MNLIVDGFDNVYEFEVLINTFYPSINNNTTDKLEEGEYTINVSVKPNIIIASLYYGYEKIFSREQQNENTKDKKQIKSIIKQLIYEIMKEQTSKVLPWGILTGIRPTKIITELIEKKTSVRDIKKIMEEEYLVSKEKIDLAMQVAATEHKILKNYSENDYSLYIGIPFCPSKCLYCSFTSFPINNWEKYTDLYVDALVKEIKYVSKRWNNKKLKTIYFGGGTPTALSSKQLDRLLYSIGENFDLSYLQEYTVEAGRPDSITIEKLIVLKKHGITRISINPQTMNQSTLELIGRNHTVEQVIDSLKQARELGFDNINMDIIIGLPKETVEEVKRTMEQIKILDPDSITVHALAIKRASKLNMNQDIYEVPPVEEVVKMQQLTIKYMHEQRMNPYYLYRQKKIAGNLENIGYAKNEKYCIYNVLIMEEQQNIIALGAGAISKMVFLKENRIERIVNVKNVVDYIERIDEMIQRKEIFFEKNALD